MKLTDKAPQLLICYVYDQSVLDGPPFSIGDEEVRKHYQQSFDLMILETGIVSGGLKGKCPSQEKVWQLKKFRRNKIQKERRGT